MVPVYVTNSNPLFKDKLLDKGGNALTRALLRDLMLYAPERFSVGVPDLRAGGRYLHIAIVDKLLRSMSLRVPPAAPYVWIGDTTYTIRAYARTTKDVATLTFVPDLTAFAHVERINAELERAHEHARRTWAREKLFPLVDVCLATEDWREV